MTTLGEFYEELNEYIDSKIPDVDLSVRRELAVFVVQRAGIRERDLVEDVARQFRYSMKSPSIRSREELAAIMAERKGRLSSTQVTEN